MKNHRRVPKLKAYNLQINLLTIKPKIFCVYIYIKYCGFIYILYYHFKNKPDFIIKLIKL